MSLNWIMKGQVDIHTFLGPDFWTRSVLPLAPGCLIVPPIVKLESAKDLSIAWPFYPSNIQIINHNNNNLSPGSPPHQSKMPSFKRKKISPILVQIPNCSIGIQRFRAQKQNKTKQKNPSVQSHSTTHISLQGLIIKLS